MSMSDFTKRLIILQIIPVVIFLLSIVCHGLVLYHHDNLHLMELLKMTPDILIATLLGEILACFFHVLGPLKKFEDKLIPGVKRLEKISDIIRTNLDNESEQLKNILNMFVHDRDISDILSREIVLNIQQTLAKPVDCVFDSEMDRTATFARHKIARAALIQMLHGMKRQIEESSKWGLSAESLTPDPEEREDGTVPKYCEFVIEQTSKASVFLGVTLMPPAWWTNSSLGLPQIIEAQKRRINELKALREYKEGTFARIFVIRENLIDSFGKLKYHDKGPEERKKCADKWVQKLGKPLTETQKSFLTLYTTANTPEEVGMLPTEILLQDDYVQQVIQMHKEAGVQVGFHLVTADDYKRAKDFVLIADSEGFECVTSSLGFEYTVQQDQSENWVDLSKNLMLRYRGFLEGRLFYYPMRDLPARGTSPTTEIGKCAVCWYDHAEKLTWSDVHPQMFLYYFNSLRKK